MPRSSPGPPCGRAEPAPPRGVSPGQKALRGRARDNARGGFLGGARSPRPGGKAVGMPRHNIIIGGKRTPGGQMGTCSGEANAVIAGVRSPPLRGGRGRGELALRGKPLDYAKGGFLGGMRSARPQGTAAPMVRHRVPTGAFTMSQWPGGGNVGVGVMWTSRACAARPSAGGEAEVSWPIGEGPEITWRWFSRRGAVSAPALQGRRHAEAQHNHRGETNARWPNGDMLRRGQVRPCGRAEPAPPRVDDPN